MTFHDIELDRNISYRSLISEVGNTSIVELGSGQEERIQRWSDTRVVANLGYGLRSWSELQALLAFKRARAHRLHSFRLWNPIDYSTNASNTPSDTASSHVTSGDVEIGTGDGTTTEFQLIKRYADVGGSAVRNITKPITGTVKVKVGSTEQSLGTDFTVNLSTGIVTLTSAPSVSTKVYAGCQFNEEVRFESDETAVTLEMFNRGDVPSGLRVVSVFDGSIINDSYPYRGASTQTFSLGFQLTPQMGALVRLEPDADDLQIELPSPVGWPLGGPYWKLVNVTAYTIDITVDGAVVATIEASGDSQRRDVVEVWLGYNGSGDIEWSLIS